MGLYDSIIVYMECPYCGEFREFEAQTKDLECGMNVFHPYDENELIDRTKLPVFKQFPEDRNAKQWKSQDELIRARSYTGTTNLKYVNIITDCRSLICDFYARRRDLVNSGYTSGFGRSFTGKIKIDDKGCLVGDIYDIEKDENLSEKQLDKYKTKYKDKYKKLKSIYKHDPIIVKKWRLFDGINK